MPFIRCSCCAIVHYHSCVVILFLEAVVVTFYRLFWLYCSVEVGGYTHYSLVVLVHGLRAC